MKLAWFFAIALVCSTFACAAEDATDGQGEDEVAAKKTLSVNGEDAKELRTILLEAGVPKSQAIESTFTSVDKITCSHAFVANKLIDSCELQLPAEPKPASGVARPPVSLMVDGKEAKHLMTALTKVGIKPLEAIESSSLSTGKVGCSTAFLPSKGLLHHCDVAQK
jgi:hypothetical protein